MALSIYPAVVYKWSSASPYWEAVRENAANKVSASHILFTDNTRDLTALGEHVKAMGLSEHNKELSFIKHKLPDIDTTQFENDPISFIRQLNKLMIGEKQYANALKRIQAALSKDNQKKKNLAPSVSSLFTSKLGTELTRIFNNFMKTISAQDSFDSWSAYFESHLNEAIDRAFKAMTEEIGSSGKEINEMYGDVEQWKEIGEAYRTIEGYSQQFQDMIKSKIDFSKITKMFQTEAGKNIYKRAKAKNKKSGFRTYADTKLSLRTQAGQRGGSVAEYINDIIRGLAGNLNMGHTVLKSEMARPDRAVIWTFDADINAPIQELLDELNEGLVGSDSLKESAKRMQEFYDRNLKNLKDSFLEYGSDKMYSLGKDFNGFQDGKQQPLNQLPDYISEAGISASVGLDFVYTAYNTLNGAILEGERETVKIEVTNILTAAAAKLLFNDWSTIGVPNSGAQVIHTFNLDGVIVPLSYVLINLGTAMIEAVHSIRQWVAVDVYLPVTTTYYPGGWRTIPRGPSFQEQFLGEWDKQFNTAEKESYFSVKFLRNFKNLMSQLIGAV